MNEIQCTHRKPFHLNVHGTQDAQDLVLVVGKVRFQDPRQALQVALQGGGALWEEGTGTSDTSTLEAGQIALDGLIYISISTDKW